MGCCNTCDHCDQTGPEDDCKWYKDNISVCRQCGHRQCKYCCSEEWHSSRNDDALNSVFVSGKWDHYGICATCVAQNKRSVIFWREEQHNHWIGDDLPWFCDLCLKQYSDDDLKKCPKCLENDKGKNVRHPWLCEKCLNWYCPEHQDVHYLYPGPLDRDADDDDDDVDKCDFCSNLSKYDCDNCRQYFCETCKDKLNQEYNVQVNHENMCAKCHVQNRERIEGYHWSSAYCSECFMLMPWSCRDREKVTCEYCKSNPLINLSTPSE